VSGQTSAGTVTHTGAPDATRGADGRQGGRQADRSVLSRAPAPPERATFGSRASGGFEEAARQLGEYLAGLRETFDLPLKLKGTEFDQHMWHLIRQVPYAHTTTYGDLARRLGEGTSPVP
jgi:O6-methylguanine-DNA--protein-cysteine methyltransferase